MQKPQISCLHNQRKTTIFKLGKDYPKYFHWTSGKIRQASGLYEDVCFTLYPLIMWLSKTRPEPSIIVAAYRNGAVWHEFMGLRRFGIVSLLVSIWNPIWNLSCKYICMRPSTIRCAKKPPGTSLLQVVLDWVCDMHIWWWRSMVRYHNPPVDSRRGSEGPGLRNFSKLE